MSTDCLETAMADTEQIVYKQCAYCREMRPLSEFLRRTGKRSGPNARRGACRSCRKQRATRARELKAAGRVQAPAQAGAAARAGAPAEAPVQAGAAARVGAPAEAPAQAGPATQAGAAARAGSLAVVSGRKPNAPRSRSGKSAQPRAAKTRSLHQPAHSPTDFGFLRPTRQGTIWMRGRTDKGRRWYQEIDMELAVTLVKEKAAVVVNRHTIRRLYSNKDFRRMILTRDNYTCYFCGEYGDTIDHLLPRAKGGHTTPINCVCACNECNQSKADRDLEEFMREG